jgi:PTH1 family peptidyl-tRNA hydrolase
MFLDYFAEKFSISFLPSKNDYYFAEHKIGEDYFSLIKPSNFVNNSGIAAEQAVSKYHIELDDLLIIYDDVYLETGAFKLNLSGGDGGHNGIGSIINSLDSENIARFRIGVGSADLSQDRIVNYVLSDLNRNEKKLLEPVFKSCAILAEAFICGGKKQLLDVNSRLTL